MVSGISVAPLFFLVIRVAKSPSLKAVQSDCLAFGMRRSLREKTASKTPLLYFLRASTKERCFSILCSMALRNNAILSCSCAEGIFMGIAKKVSSLILTLSCLAPLSPDI